MLTKANFPCSKMFSECRTRIQPETLEELTLISSRLYLCEPSNNFIIQATLKILTMMMMTKSSKKFIINYHTNDWQYTNHQ